jgi:hypothetical protein
MLFTKTLIAASVMMVECFAGQTPYFIRTDGHDDEEEDASNHGSKDSSSERSMMQK